MFLKGFFSEQSLIMKFKFELSFLLSKIEFSSFSLLKLEFSLFSLPKIEFSYSLNSGQNLYIVFFRPAIISWKLAHSPSMQEAFRRLSPSPMTSSIFSSLASPATRGKSLLTSSRSSQSERSERREVSLYIPSSFFRPFFPAPRRRNLRPETRSLFLGFRS